MIPARTEREALSQILRVDKPFACFIEKRLNRFVVQVKEGRKTLKAHINNTGRLEEFLVHGKKGYCLRPKKQGLTDCRLFAVEERSFGALIDTRLQMNAFENMAESDQLPWLEDCTILKRNARIGTSLIDYALDCGKQNVYLEVKSAVLREGAHALYPDCPSLRGQRHIRELAAHVQKAGRGIIVFMAALPGITAFRPNKKADPAVFKLLNKARLKGVVIKAIGLYYNPEDHFIYLYNPDLKVDLS